MLMSSQKGAMMGGEDTESKLEPDEDVLVKGSLKDTTPFVFTCGI